MADTIVHPSNGRHGLGGSRDADLEGIDPNQYDVFTTDKNLAAARQAYPDYDWFACFSVKDKRGNYANVRYTLTLDRPPAGTTLYYYYNGTANRLDHVDAGNKGNQPVVRVTLNVGDPPIGAR